MQQIHQRRLLYDQWVRSFAPELYRFAYRLTGNRQTAEDLLQESFLEAWRSLDKQRQPERARAWLYQILRYRFAHYVRDNRAQNAVLPLGDHTPLPPGGGAPAPLDAMAERETLQRALNSLAPEIRETFLMVFMEGAKCREAAEALHIPLGTVLSRISRARSVLREALKNEYKDLALPSRVPIEEEH